MICDLTARIVTLVTFARKRGNIGAIGMRSGFIETPAIVGWSGVLPASRFHRTDDLTLANVPDATSAIRLRACRVFPAFRSDPYSCQRAFKEIGKTLNVRPSIKFAFHLNVFMSV